MRAFNFIYSLVAASFIETYALRQRGGSSHSATVAGIVAVHPPTFRYFTKFMRQWEQCPEGRETMDLMPVFSTEEDHDKFKRQLKHKYSDFNFDDHVFTPLISQSVPSGAKLGAWKKLDGLAQVLSHMDGYEFALIFDAEVRLNTCEGFAHLLDNLRKKHVAGIWYGDRTVWGRHGMVVNSDDGPVVQNAACSLAPPINGHRHSAWNNCTGNPSVMHKIAQATHGFQIYTWWNELPYVHIDTAQRMFQSWAEFLKITDPSFDKMRTSVSCEQCHVLTNMIPHMQVPISPNQRNIPATSVTGNMGVGHGEIMEIAGRAFEHLMYQLYTVVEGSFHIQDLTSAMRNHRGSSVLERFWYLPEEDRKTVLETIHPLWLPCEVRTKANPHPGRHFPSVLLNFHVDRCASFEHESQ